MLANPLLAALDDALKCPQVAHLSRADRLRKLPRAQGRNSLTGLSAPSKLRDWAEFFLGIIPGNDGWRDLRPRCPVRPWTRSKPNMKP